MAVYERFWWIHSLVLNILKLRALIGLLQYFSPIIFFSYLDSGLVVDHEMVFLQMQTYSLF